MTTRIQQATAVKVIVALAVGLLTLAAPAALAAPAGEQQQGAQVLGEVHAGKLDAQRLTATQYEHVGQYLMGRALGSAETYEAMDAVMDRMMGQPASDRMYRYLGERYLGKSPRPDSRSLPMYGWMASMMSAYRGSAPYAGMMGRFLRGQGSGGNGVYGMMGGSGMMGGYAAPGSSSSGGWPAGAIALVAVLGGLLLAGAVAFALPRLHGQPGTSAARRV